MKLALLIAGAATALAGVTGFLGSPSARPQNTDKTP